MQPPPEAGPPTPASGYYVPVAAGPAPQIGELKTAAIAVYIGLGLNIAVNLVNAVVAPLAINASLTDADNRGTLSVVYGLTSLLQLAFIVATAGAFITW